MYKIVDILTVSEVPKATYYRWKKKYTKSVMSPLEEVVVLLCEESHFRYGHRKIKALLKRMTLLIFLLKNVDQLLAGLVEQGIHYP
jgi:hypothetical protein